MPLDKDEQAVMRFCKEKYPEYVSAKTVDEGDILIYYLRYKGEEYNSYGKLDLVVYYNTWYPSEFNVSRLEPVFN